ncbi:protein HIDE1-like [Sapajus apella]|uniref:Protein HIDE1-like n=1 Tax=Sapajus apella TaxID=9515 RepID=A0A6J3FIT8_SAPAP|nr:protein HIDE1-like [Sapajus apella]
MAPGDFLGANSTLYRGGQVVQLLQAPPNQCGVTFNLSGSSNEAPGGPFHCQYRVIGKHNQPQLSDLSEPLNIFPVPTWILVLSLSLAGALLLLAGLVAVALVVRKVKLKNLQKKRDGESCWAQINFNTTDMSFDNSLFTVSPKMMPEEDPASLDDHSGTTATPSNARTWKMPTSMSSSPEPLEFSTSGPASEAEDWGASSVSRHSGPEVPPATSGGGGLCWLLSQGIGQEMKGNPGLGIFIIEDWERGHRYGPGTGQATRSSPLIVM